MERASQLFVDDMASLGLRPRVEDRLVVCDVVAVAGHRAGETTLLGVDIDELSGWPVTPPHWVHLPAEVKFGTTNSEASSTPGWLKHSRNCAGWGDVPPSISWHAHLQAVLSEVVA